MLLTGSKDCTAKLWAESTGQCLQTLRGHLDRVGAVAFHPEGLLVATASNDSTARIWDVESGSVLRTFAAHHDEVLSVAFSFNGSKVMTGGQEGLGLVWATATGQPFQPGTLQAHGGPVTATAWAPGEHMSEVMLTASADRTARTWNHFGNEVSVLVGHEEEITSAAWAPDGSTVATASEDGCAKVWHWMEGECLADCVGHGDAVTSVAYSPDSRLLVTGGADCTAKIWSLRGECLQTLEGHEGEITSVAFSPDGAVVATGSDDGTARLWNAERGDCFVTFRGHSGGGQCQNEMGGGTKDQDLHGLLGSFS